MRRDGSDVERHRVVPSLPALDDNGVNGDARPRIRSVANDRIGMVALAARIAISGASSNGRGMRLEMRRKANLDPDYASFLLAYAASGVFRPGSAEARLVRVVAYRGLSALNFRQTRLWYENVLPIVSKPLDEQLAVSRIVRGGGRVPPRIEAGTDVGEDTHPFGLPAEIDDPQTQRDLAAIARALRRAA